MANSGAFVLPADVKLTLDGNSLSIENAGDIVIEGAPAQKLSKLHSTGGNVVLSPPKAVSLDSIHAPGGTVTVSGKVTVDLIEAANVDFSGGTLKVQVIKGSGSIGLRGGKLEANVVVGGTVDVDANIKGRATAIHSTNELGAHKLKGCFSLSEFVGLMPGGADLLAAHGIEVPEDEDEDDDDDDEEQPAAESRDGPDDAAADESAAADDAGDAGEADAGAGDEAAADGDAGAEAPVDDEVRAQVADALDKIRSSYEDDVPPPIARLGALVDGGDYGGLKVEINTIWSDLLKHHQQTGLYISNTVTHMFQTIQLLMRKVEA